MKWFLKLISRRWYIFLILTFVLLFVFYKFNSIKPSKETSFKVKRQTVKDTLTLSGSIDVEEHITLRFQSSGRLAWVAVKEGDYVKRYQTLASLDQRELQKNLKKYLNTYVQERNTFGTSLENANIKNTGGLSEDARRQVLRTLENVQYDLNNSIIDIELKQLAIEYSNLFTPIEGIVVRVGSPFAGVNITPAQAEIEIINPKSVFFSATADQSDVVNLKQEMQGDIVLDSYPNDNIKGNISTISFIPKQGETGTVYEVKIPINLDNEDYKYRFGMTGDISFILKERKNIIAVPTSFIKSEKNKKYVIKLIDGNKTKSYIKTGEEIDSSTEVTFGLKEGDTIYDQT